MAKSYKKYQSWEEDDDNLEQSDVEALMDAGAPVDVVEPPVDDLPPEDDDQADGGDTPSVDAVVTPAPAGTTAAGVTYTRLPNGSLKPT